MSGRKKWEVQNLLADGEKARQRIDARYREEIAQNIGRIEEFDAADHKLQDKAGELKIPKADLPLVHFGEAGPLKERLAAIDQKLRANDAASDALRRKMQSDTHSGYFDKEYAEAQRLNGIYEAVRKEQQSLRDASESVAARRGKEHAALAQAVEKNEEEARNMARAAIEAARRKAEAVFFDPVDFVENGEAAQPIKLFDYLSRFGGRPHKRDAFDKALQKAEADLAKDKFESCHQAAREAAAFGNAALDRAAALEENLIKKTQLAVKIGDVMHEMHYDVKAEFLAEDSPLHGYKVRCTVGKEIIDFDRVDIGLNGAVTVDLDHTEPPGGDCAHSMREIAERMRAEGVTLTDIKKDGSSLLGGRQKLAQRATAVQAQAAPAGK